MKKLALATTLAVLALGATGTFWHGTLRAAHAQTVDRDYYPDLKKKIVPILTFGSNLNIGVAQVQGAERDVERVKAVAQLETDYKDVARIKILVPVQSENVISKIDRAPGVSVSAIADYAVKK